MLSSKRIVVGVCGGIATYKVADLVSKLRQAGADIDVILTEHATHFVSALTFAALSQRPVYDDLWEATGEAAARHISLGHEADLLIIAPATANTLARLAYGMADDLLTTVALATTAPLLIAPAMETNMYQHPATQANLRMLVERGAMIVPPETGRLASGKLGVGRLPDTATLLAWISKALGVEGDLAGRRVVVTAGGTREPVDPVRYIGNRSSGLMGFALAEEARDRGADVTLIVGAVSAPLPLGVTVQRVETAVQMRDATLAAIREADALVMAAAVADYRVERPATHKIKKGSPEENPDGSLTLRLTRNPDILAEINALVGAGGAPRLIRAGFAAETDDVEAHAAAKLKRKGLDLLIANDVSKPGSGFGAETNEVTLLHASGEIERLELAPKRDVASAIWYRMVALLWRRDAK
jgi:phosphopantothenoylcysteine decarboxylase/phosphopantothenate--cysteine ligase